MKIIYNIVNPVTNDVIYVGQTSDFEKRKRKHLCGSHNDELQLAINSMKENNIIPVFNILETCVNDDFSVCEKKWIYHFRNLGFDLCNRDKGKEKVKQQKRRLPCIPVYLPDDKIAKLKKISEDKRQPLTRLLESGVDWLIKKDYVPYPTTTEQA